MPEAQIGVHLNPKPLNVSKMQSKRACVKEPYLQPRGPSLGKTKSPSPTDKPSILSNPCGDAEPIPAWAQHLWPQQARGRTSTVVLLRNVGLDRVSGAPYARQVSHKEDLANRCWKLVGLYARNLRAHAQRVQVCQSLSPEITIPIH